MFALPRKLVASDVQAAVWKLFKHGVEEEKRRSNACRALPEDNRDDHVRHNDHTYQGASVVYQVTTDRSQQRTEETLPEPI